MVMVFTLTWPCWHKSYNAPKEVLNNRTRIAGGPEPIDIKKDLTALTPVYGVGAVVFQQGI